MIAVALKGLAGRKVRALLTAFADRHRRLDGQRHIHPHRHDAEDLRRSLRRIVRRDRRRHRGQGDRRVARSAARRRFPSRCSPRCGRCREVEAAAGTVSPAEVNAADIIGGDGKAVAKESLGVSIDAANTRFSPLKLKTGEWPTGPRQVVIDAGTAKKRALRGRRHRQGRDAGQDRLLPDHRHRLLRRGRLARLRQHRDLGRQDRAGAAGSRGSLRHDLDRGQGRHLAGRARPRRAAARPAHARGQGQRQAGRGGVRAARQGHGVHPLLPARLRRHRAVRRRVRDLQHALDHRRPAHARVRDAADARRLAQAGPALGQARGPRDRPASPR